MHSSIHIVLSGNIWSEKYMAITYLDIHNISPLVGLEVSVERDNTLLSELAREQVSGATAVTLCVRHSASL